MDIESNSMRDRLIAREADTAARIDALAAAGRADEADLQKVVRNVYGLFAELLAEVGSMDAFLDHLAALRAPWQHVRGLAAAHNDYRRVAVEDAKLATLDDAVRIAYSMQREEA